MKLIGIVKKAHAKMPHSEAMRNVVGEFRSIDRREEGEISSDSTPKKY